MARSKAILIAVGMMSGGVRDKEGKLISRDTLADGEELTTAKAKAMGLDADAIDALRERGKLAAVTARMAEASTDDAAELAAEKARADKAEAENKTLTGRVAELEKQLEAAKKGNAGSGGQGGGN